MNPDEALDLIARRTAMRLSMMVKHQDDKAGVRGSYLGREDDWESDLADLETEMVQEGLLVEAKDVGGPEPDNVVTLRGSNLHNGTEATESGSGSRPCSFCGGAGEKTVDMEIDGYTYEVVVDCLHPYDT